MPTSRRLNLGSGPEVSAIDIYSTERFINRELSWLSFNTRVLEEADNVNHPLLERVRFLSISAANLDEFYMVRVAGLKGQVANGVNTTSQDGLTPAQQLVAINREAKLLLDKQQECWRRLRNELCANGIAVIDIADITRADRKWLDTRFMEHVFPVLTPLAVDPAHPFPFIPNLGFAMVLHLTRLEDGEVMRALLPLPIRSKKLRLVFTLSANPCDVTKRGTWIPMAASLDSGELLVVSSAIEFARPQGRGCRPSPHGHCCFPRPYSPQGRSRRR